MSQTYNNLLHPYNTRSNANGMEKLLKYKISSKELGRGAFSKVLEATFKEANTKVAMKIVKLEDLEDKYITLSLNEVQLLRRIHSPNVIKLYDAFVHQKTLHVALELIDGVDLAVRIQVMRDRGSVFSERSIWYKFHQICCGLKDLHDKRILHRDLKPANIFITSKYQVKIGDLGLSRQCSPATNNLKTHVGTEYYMAPERNIGEGYHFQSDIWSLGCLLYELCTFRSPFNGELTNAYSLHKKINNGDIIPFPMNVYSEHLSYFTYACLNTKSEERPNASECFEAARAMYEKFESMLADYKAATRQTSSLKKTL
uniref:non-specific serine/threonine protein kinase n=1 Tax=Panagrolaimus superbus TaxID=310955 RepID=A0A914YYH1_9BILA